MATDKKTPEKTEVQLNPDNPGWDRRDKPARSEGEFRRDAAIAIASAFVARHGGFPEDQQEILARRVWQYADALVATEHAEPLPLATAAVTTGPPQRAAKPNDEWGVRHGQRLHRGFVSHREAELAIEHRYPGGVVVQLAGAEVNTAPAFA